MKSRLVISVDDGHPLDLKTAGILLKKRIPATFYIPIRNIEGLPTLKPKDIKYLAKHFEIGGHTYNHRDLTKLSPIEAKKEVRDGKERLEDIIGRKVYSFCPPRGKYNQNVIKIIKDLGFKSLRTARTINFNSYSERRFIQNPNFHIYPHTLEKDLRDTLFSGDFYSFLTRLKYANISHIELLRILRSEVNMLHIWFHSWELEKFGLWGVLETL